MDVTAALMQLAILIGRFDREFADGCDVGLLEELSTEIDETWENVVEWAGKGGYLPKLFPMPVVPRAPISRAV